MAEERKFRYESYCGLYCGACSLLLATEAGDVSKIAADWHVPVADVECFGCKSDKVAKHCPSCEMKTCAEKRGVETCGACSDYPCAVLKAFMLDGWPHHIVGVCNLETIRRDGLARWLAEQETRWRCACGRKFEYYQANCPACGRKLRDSRVEAAELIAEKNIQIKPKVV